MNLKTVQEKRKTIKVPGTGSVRTQKRSTQGSPGLGAVNSFSLISTTRRLAPSAGRIRIEELRPLSWAWIWCWALGKLRVLGPTYMPQHHKFFTQTLRAMAAVSGIYDEHRIQHFFSATEIIRDSQRNRSFGRQWIPFLAITNCCFSLFCNFQFFPQFVTLEKMWKWGFHMFEMENTLLLEKMKSLTWSPKCESNFPQNQDLYLQLERQN